MKKSIQPAKGKRGILLPEMGAVTTTRVAGGIDNKYYDKDA